MEEAMMGKNRVLIVGATGNMGRRLVKASTGLGYPTFVLYRPENARDYGKCQTLMSFKMQGAHLLQGSFDDHESLVSALKQVDVVICVVAGDQILTQLKLVEAIKEAGNIKRFLPTEFGMDADRMENAISPGDMILDQKRVVRRAIENAGIPYTYIIANCFAGQFLASLAQIGIFMTPRDHVDIYGNGDQKSIWVDEDDVAMYSLLAANDPRAVNTMVHIRPPTNILSQMEVVEVWEKLIGKELDKTLVPAEEWLRKLDEDGLSFRLQIEVAHVYQIFYLGDLDYKIEGPNNLETNDLYPDQKYVSVEEYLKRFA